MNALLTLEGGYHAGPLFVIRKRKPSKKELHKCGWWRRRAEYRAIPVWMRDDKKEQAKIAAIYDECARLNKRDGAKSWAVDHTVPLNSQFVCGMHIAINLEIIPYDENAKKSNNWWPDMPEEQMTLFGKHHD